ncbi:hypothetical protein Tco_0201811, partial [Tanacetum coccineum]
RVAWDDDDVLDVLSLDSSIDERKSLEVMCTSKRYAWPNCLSEEGAGSRPYGSPVARLAHQLPDWPSSRPVGWRLKKGLKESELQQQESLVTEGTTLKANLRIDGTTLDASLVTKGTTLEASLVNEGIEIDDSLVSTKSTDESVTSSEQLDERSSSETTFNRFENENSIPHQESSSSDRNDANTNIGPTYDSNTVIEVPHLNNDTFENVFAHRIQSHEQPESIPDTYKVNKNNSNIISDIPNMDPNRDKEEHDDVYYEKQRAFFASLINNLKCDLEKCNKDNREAQQANALLTNNLERYKFASVKSKSYSHEYENEIFEQNSSLENKNRCLKKIITEISKQAANVKEEMTKRCAQYEKEIAKLETYFISLKHNSQNNSLTFVQNGHVFSNKSDEAKIKFDTEDLETINIELEYSVASLLKENEHLKMIYKNQFDSIKRSRVQIKSSNVYQNEAENLKSQLSEFADTKFDKVMRLLIRNSWNGYCPSGELDGTSTLPDGQDMTKTVETNLVYTQNL